MGKEEYIREIERILNGREVEKDLKRIYNKTEDKILKEFYSIISVSNGNNLPSRTLVNRLSTLTRKELSKFSDEQIIELEDYMIESYRIVNKHLCKMFGITYVKLNRKDILKKLRFNWSGVRYDKRIKENISKLAFSLNETFNRGFIQEQSNKEIEENIVKKFITSMKHSMTLIRTEIAFTITEATLSTSKEAKSRYGEITAVLDNRTSEICLDKDGTIVDLDKDLIIGVDIPPFHPNCRTILMPKF